MAKKNSKKARPFIKNEQVTYKDCRLDIDYTKPCRVRDMRKDAIENGSHNADKFFGKKFKGDIDFGGDK